MQTGPDTTRPKQRKKSSQKTRISQQKERQQTKVKTKTNFIMVQVKQQKLQSPFEEADESAKTKSKFLGIFNKRYLRTFSGAVHGLASTMALILGNLLFLFHTVLGFDRSDASTIFSSFNTTFFICNMISAGVTYFFFWNKVQVRYFVERGKNIVYFLQQEKKRNSLLFNFSLSF